MIPSVRARWAEVLSDASPMTVDDMMALPEDRWRYELVAGRLVERPSADLQYDIIADGLLAAVRASALATGIGLVSLRETGFVVSHADEPDTVFVPALAFVRTDHAGHPPAFSSAADTPSVRCVPDLVVEIASPHQRRTDLAARVSVWLAAGAHCIWVVSPARRQVDAWRSGVDAPDVASYSVHETLMERDVLSDFSYPVAHLFL